MNITSAWYKVAIFSLLTLVIGEQVSEPDPIPRVNIEGSQNFFIILKFLEFLKHWFPLYVLFFFPSPLFVLVCVHINFIVLLIIKCYDL